MNSYSDLILLIAAIAIYGTLTINTDRNLVLNNQKLTDSEIVYGAISTAQDVINKARWTPYANINKSTLLAAAEDTMYQVTVDISNKAVSKSSKPNKIITVKVTNKYLTDANGNKKSINMNLLKTDF